MGDAEVPGWLKSLPLAPEYRPTETEFADPIAFISRVEEEAAAFGICKVVPPIPKPSKKFVFHNLRRSLSKSPELGAAAVDAGSRERSAEDAVFTTRHQELGSRRTRLAIHKQVWQSGELYTLEQFEAKSRAFARAHLGGAKCENTLLVEAMFWKAMGEKPMYIEYANDVPGSGFGEPKEPLRCYSHPRRWRRKFNRAVGNMLQRPGNIALEESRAHPPQPDGGSVSAKDWDGSAGWKLSNSPWNLQVIARSPGSLTRFMPDEVPGVTSPMVYIGMLFSWFAWHVEDHELHSLNFLHTGSPKTWYAVPGNYASRFEEVVRMQGYGGQVDRLAALTLLGEKTTLLSPEVIGRSGIPCCRLVQNPGEFVVTFPRAYHVGFSHGFNCGEAANFATPKWLKVAKDAAVRRAAMNYLPMLSHQQLLYMLTMSFISRVPRAFLPGVRSSRLRDRKKEERETLVKKAFLDDLTNEHRLVHLLLGKDPVFYAVLWHPDLLPSSCNGSQMFPSTPSLDDSGPGVAECKNDLTQCNNESNVSLDPKMDSYLEKDMVHENAEQTNDIRCKNISSPEKQKDGLYNDNNLNVLDLASTQSSYVDDGDLPCGLDIDSGTLACVACGILGYPFMSIVQPSDEALKLISAECKITDDNIGNSKSTEPVSSCLVDIIKESAGSEDLAVSYSLPVTIINDSGDDHIVTLVEDGAQQVGPADENIPKRNNVKVDANKSELSDKQMKDENSMGMEVIHAVGDELESPNNNSGECCHGTGIDILGIEGKWNTSNKFSRPRIFCLQHALEVWELLQCKGGAHMLIICHSDYLKVKAHAVSVAEDIDDRFDCEDVPMNNASQADLDLIYVSIDDEEYEEDGEDWTAKMGLNLRYCVKLKKQSSSNQEELTLGLGGLFSNQGPLSIVSGLQWHCRKSRTHHRVIAPGQMRSQGAPSLNKDNPNIRSSFPDLSAGIQIDKTFNSGTQSKKRRGRPRKVASGEMVDKAGASVGHSACADAVRVDGFSKLASPSLSSSAAPEDTQVQQEHLTLERRDVKSSFVVGDSAKTEESCSIADVGSYAKLEIHAGSISNSTDCISNPTTCTDHVRENENSSCQGESSINNDVHESECPSGIGSQIIGSLEPSGIGSQIIGSLDSQQEIQTAGELIMVDDSGQVQDKPMTTIPKDIDNSAVLDDQPTRSAAIVSGSGLQAETAEHYTFCNPSVKCFINQDKGTDVDTDVRTEEGNQADLTLCPIILNSEVSEIHQIPSASRVDTCNRKQSDSLQSVKGGELRSPVQQLKLYERRRKKRQGEGDQVKSDSGPTFRNKRKREVDQIMDFQLSCNGFVHSPCEGLRPRSQRAVGEKACSSIPPFKKSSEVKSHQGGQDGSVRRKNEDKSSGPYQCDLQGCHMSFQTGRELSLHKRNRCTYKGCGKRFISHKYAMRHQCVHDEERPLKCPWKGCNVSFKWAWARTEHVRVHTGERPYKCNVSGCGLTFRFVSDFSRHRRKTGHSPS